MSVVFLQNCSDKKRFFLEIVKKNNNKKTTSWSSGNAFVSGAGSLRFKSRADQIGQSVATGSPSLQYFFERSCVARRRNDAQIGPANLLTLRCNTESILKDLKRVY